MATKGVAFATGLVAMHSFGDQWKNINLEKGASETESNIVSLPACSLVVTIHKKYVEDGEEFFSINIHFRSLHFFL
jgi:hypothetical protein